MFNVQAQKFQQVILPAAIVNNASNVSAVVDTLGFSRCTFVISLGATDIAMTALKVQESDAETDANTLTNGTDVTDSIFGTASNSTGSVSTLPSATDDNKTFVIDLDLRVPRKRYLKLISTFGNGATGGFVSAIAILTEGRNTPTTATERGCAQIVNAI